MFIQIKNLYFSYPYSHSNLFEDFSLQFSEGWTCVAGSNGCGKSSLLRLISGSITPDSGKISLTGAGEAGIIYCEQETAEIPENLYSAFWSSDNDVRKLFSRLCITEEMIERYESLSGGEKKRIQIACALAENPCVLLLDEPTNHLDSKSSSMISDILESFSGIGIMVSHDRSFADRLCSKTIYLYNEAAFFAGGRDCTVFDSYSCGLSEALELRKKGSMESREEWERLNAKAASERQRSARLESENQKAKSRLSKKAIDSRDHDAQAKIDAARISGKDRVIGDAKARLESQIRQTESERDGIKKALQRKEGFSVSGSDNFKPLVIDEEVIEAGIYKLKIPHIEISQGMKVALVGENGVGKSLFVGHVILLLEKLKRKKNLLYLPQEISDEEREAVLSRFFALEEDEKGEVLSTLFRLGSQPERLALLRNSTENSDQSGEILSPGELRKLMIALAVQNSLSLLILDEPTNHMDITSVLALENALSALSCPMLVVSHDKAFLRKITNVCLLFEKEGNQGQVTISSEPA